MAMSPAEIATKRREWATLGKAAAPAPVKEFHPNVPAALECLYKAARAGEITKMADQVRRAINHLQEDKE